MAISFSPPRNPSSWNTWHHPRTTRGETFGSSFAVGSAPFPRKYLPANAFWAFTPSSHCRFPAPWIFSGDLLSNFLFTGGGSGLLAGSFSGLFTVALQLRDPTRISFGIGSVDGYGIPTVGFCFGDRYKEHAYFKILVQREGTAPITSVVRSESSIDVFQRCRQKRIYVIEGTVVRFVAGTDQTNKTFILTLDLTGKVPDGIENVVGDKIKVLKKNGGTCNLTIKELLSNFDIVVTNDSTLEPESGDFYKMDKPWCIEDPYMMSGFWYGQEGEIARTSELPESTYNLPITSHNIPYNKVKFSGVYVCKNKTDGTPVLLSSGTIFGETDFYKWVWISYGDVKTFYPDLDRFFEDEIFVDEEGNEIINPEPDSTLRHKVKKFEVGSESDVTAWIEADGVKYVRMEIDIGGNPTMQNWHSSALTKCFFTQNGMRFSILGQPNADVIDVSIRDITDSTDLDLKGEGTIINQYAWMINEHYSSDELFFSGNFSSNSYDPSTGISNVTIAAKETGFSTGTIVQNTDESFSYLTPNSFYNRFISTYKGSGLKKIWKKFNGWKLNGDKVYEVVDGNITFSSINSVPTPNISVNVKVYGKVESSYGGLFFDEPYKRFSNNASFSVPLFSLEMYEGIELGFPVLCADMSYLSNPIEQFLPSGTIVGITGAKYWSFGRGNDFRDVVNEKDLFLMVTQPVTQKSVSAIHHKIKQQDCIFYKDKFTENVTMRTAALDFKEYPVKHEIAIGFSEYGKLSGSFPLSFDTTKDRVRLIELEVVPKEDEFNGIKDDFGSALTFQINNSNDYYGFPSTGSGTFDFRATRLNGKAEGEVEFNNYNYKGDFLSPVYLYSQQEGIQNLKTLSLELGISTKDKLFVKNGDPKPIRVDYVKNKQVLSTSPIFDCHLMNDGEFIMIYGKDVKEFIVSGLPARIFKPSEWITSKSIYAIGSSNGGFQWGTPSVDDLIFNSDPNYQYPIMILNSCEYISSAYHPLTDQFSIFMKCYHSKSMPFYGFLTIQKSALPQGMLSCKPTNEFEGVDLPFWARSSFIMPDILNNPNMTYVSKEGEFLPNPPKDSVVTEDIFVRVLGPQGTNCEVTSNEVTDIATISILETGIPIILYNNSDGEIRMLSSNNDRKWTKSGVVLAKTAASAVLVEDNIFYITPEGIMVISGIRQLVYNATLVPEGTDQKNIEEIQKQFDDSPHTLIGSGVIDPQRLSGYVSHDGTSKVFYYNSDAILCCLESNDNIIWKMANNF